MTGVVRGANLPAGLIIDPQPISLGVGEWRQIALTARIDRNSALWIVSGLLRPYSIAVDLTSTLGQQRTQQIDLSLTVHSSSQSWHWNGPTLAVYWNASLTILSDGRFVFQEDAHYTNLLPPNFQIGWKALFPGHDLELGSRGGGPFGEVWHSFVGHRSYIANEYLSLSRGPVAMSVKVKQYF